MALLDVLIGIAVGLSAGAIGSFLLWITVGPRVVEWALGRWIDRNVPEDPERDAAAHKPMNPRMKRVLGAMSYHVGQTISGVFGQIEANISKELAEKGPAIAQKALQGGAPQLAELAAQFAGGASKGKGSPWGGLTELFSMLSMLQQMGGALGVRPNGGGAAVAALPAHPFLR